MMFSFFIESRPEARRFLKDVKKHPKLKEIYLKHTGREIFFKVPLPEQATAFSAVIKQTLTTHGINHKMKVYEEV